MVFRCAVCGRRFISGTPEMSGDIPVCDDCFREKTENNMKKPKMVLWPSTVEGWNNLLQKLSEPVPDKRVRERNKKSGKT